MSNESTICAISTASGNGAIAVIRLSGNKAIDIASKVLKLKKKGSLLSEQAANTIHYCTLHNNDNVIDDVMAAIFKAPKSYTGEDMIEINCHGSTYIQQKTIEILIDNGASLAQPGEFTLRAFMNGKLDLTQAEAVSDLIASNSKSAHLLAVRQMRGGFSNKISELRGQLLNFISLLELELDFSEEDVEFADRTQLVELLTSIEEVSKKLIKSFELGNVIKNGVPVAIIGKTNAGKSTLLNKLLKEDRAIVSEIPGTTRDTIEDIIAINGINYRFIDTAGLRDTSDTIEIKGIERTQEKIEQAKIILHLIDINESKDEIEKQINDISIKEDQQRLIIFNKIDLASNNVIREYDTYKNSFKISAKNDDNIDSLFTALNKIMNLSSINETDVIINNSRHYEALSKSVDAINRAKDGLKNNISGELIAMDIREVLSHLGHITGEVTDDEVLGNIFKNFCIGK